MELNTQTTSTQLYEAVSLTLLTLLAIGLGAWLPFDNAPRLEAISTVVSATPAAIRTLFATDNISITVAADGSGDYPTLPAALQAAPPDATIQLSAGTFTLNTPLTVTKPVRLVGVGMEATRITANTPGYVARVTATFAAENLTFEHTGSQTADVLLIEDAAVWISQCRFQGAILDEAATQFGAGLRLTGAARGQVSDSIAESNGAMGIIVEGTAQLTLENNLARENQLAGIAWLGNASGIARGNECRANFIGLLINDNAQPTLEANRFIENEKSGLAYYGNHGGSARANECSHNGHEGIYVGAQAYPTLEDNICTGNAAVGIGYFDNSSGLSRRNTCTLNLRGIYVGEQATPILEENSCTDNEKSGITYAGSAGGVARGNICTTNGITGIYIGERAQPTVEDNVCTANGKAGLAYFDTAGGIARGNICAENPIGLHIAITANPVLDANTCGK